MKLGTSICLNKKGERWALRRRYITTEAITNIAISQSCNEIYCIKLRTYLRTYFLYMLPPPRR